MSGVVVSVPEIAAAADPAAVVRTLIGEAPASTVVLFTGPAGPARPHVHRTHDELCVLVSGRGSVTIGATTTPVAAGSVIVIPMGVPHTAHFDEPFAMLSVYAPHDDPDAPDREFVDEADLAALAARERP